MEIKFIQRIDAKKIIINCDNYFDVMSSYDYSIRMGISCRTNYMIGRDDYDKYVHDHVLDWDDNEKKYISETIMDVITFLKKIEFKGVISDTISIIKTDGLEDLRDFMGYCRKGIICINKKGIVNLSHKFFIYALFIIFLRTNVNIRNKLYNSIGFHACNDIFLPQNIKSKSIVHPNGYHRDAYIEVIVNDSDTSSNIKSLNTQQKIRCIPIMLFDNNNYGSFFTKTNVKFLRLCCAESGMMIPYTIQNGLNKQYILYDVSDLKDFFEQIGESAHYFHPDEIIATRFSKIVYSAMWFPDTWHHNDNVHEQTMKEILFDMTLNDEYKKVKTLFNKRTCVCI